VGLWASGDLSNLVCTCYNLVCLAAHEILPTLIIEEEFIKTNLFFQRWIPVLVPLKTEKEQGTQEAMAAEAPGQQALPEAMTAAQERRNRSIVAALSSVYWIATERSLTRNVPVS